MKKYCKKCVSDRVYTYLDTIKHKTTIFFNKKNVLLLVGKIIKNN